jgi:hypothetical protein
MKMVNKIALLAIVILAFAACRDRAAEKRIAELESRLNSIEGKKSASLPAQSSPTDVAAAQAPAADEKPEGPLPVAAFAVVEHDFGTVPEGPKVA